MNVIQFLVRSQHSGAQSARRKDVLLYIAIEEGDDCKCPMVKTGPNVQDVE